MRIALSPLLLLSLPLTGCDASPYGIFGRKDLRPGIDIAAIRKSSDRESRYELRCDSMWAGAQQCELPTRAGTMNVIVGSDERIVRITIAAPDSFFNWDITPTNEPLLRLHAKELKAKWDSIRPSQTYSYRDGGVEHRWTADRRWVAQIWYSPWSRYVTSSEALYRQHAGALARVPDSIAVSDQPALEKLFGQHPMAQLLTSTARQSPQSSTTTP